jgi:hypothetical protein
MENIWKGAGRLENIWKGAGRYRNTKIGVIDTTFPITDIVDSIRTVATLLRLMSYLTRINLQYTHLFSVNNIFRYRTFDLTISMLVCYTLSQNVT